MWAALTSALARRLNELRSGGLAGGNHASGRGPSPNPSDPSVRMNAQLGSEVRSPQNRNL